MLKIRITERSGACSEFYRPILKDFTVTRVVKKLRYKWKGKVHKGLLTRPSPEIHEYNCTLRVTHPTHLIPIMHFSQSSSLPG